MKYALYAALGVIVLLGVVNVFVSKNAAGATFYIQEGDSVYHLAKCAHLSGKEEGYRKEDAEARGYVPCGDCIVSKGLGGTAIDRERVRAEAAKKLLEQLESVKRKAQEKADARIAQEQETKARNAEAREAKVEETEAEAIVQQEAKTQEEGAQESSAQELAARAAGEREAAQQQAAEAVEQYQAQVAEDQRINFNKSVSEARRAKVTTGHTLTSQDAYEDSRRRPAVVWNQGR